MTRRYKRSVIAGGLLLCFVLAGLAFHRAPRIATFAWRYLSLDLSSTPFGAPSSAIPGLTPYAEGVPSDHRGLTWYATTSAAAVPLPDRPSSGALYGYDHGKLAEIRVTRWTLPAGDYRFSRALFLYSMSPSLFSQLRNTCEFQFSDSQYSLHFGGGCDPLRPMLSYFILTARVP